MKTLLLMRHAKSNWNDTNLADHDRPLAARGRSDAPRMAELLREQELVPDALLCSTALRARQTAEGLFEVWGEIEHAHFTRDLYHADTDDFLEELVGIEGNPQTVLVIAHNPGMERCVEALTGEWRRMPTAAIAQIELSINDWASLNSETEGRLVNLWRPKEI